MSDPVDPHRKKKKGMKSKHRTTGPSVPVDLALGIQAAPVVSPSRDEVQRAVLLASVVGQPFEDVKFWVFSRRASDGTVDTPLPLLANSRLPRKASSHFGFGECCWCDDRFRDTDQRFSKQFMIHRQCWLQALLRVASLISMHPTRLHEPHARRRTTTHLTVISKMRKRYWGKSLHLWPKPLYPEPQRTKTLVVLHCVEKVRVTHWSAPGRVHLRTATRARIKPTQESPKMTVT